MPTPGVAGTIPVDKGARTLTITELVPTNVMRSVVPSVRPLAMSLPIQVLPFETTSRGPDEDTFAMSFAVLELPFVVISVVPFVASFAVAKPIPVETSRIHAVIEFGWPFSRGTTHRKKKDAEEQPSFGRRHDQSIEHHLQGKGKQLV